VDEPLDLHLLGRALCGRHQALGLARHLIFAHEGTKVHPQGLRHAGEEYAPMTPAAPRTRITLSPDVTRAVFNPDPAGELARLWIRYLKGMVVEDGFDLEDVVAPDVRCIELDIAGYPPGIAGLRQFRDNMREAMPDESIHVLYLMIYPEQATIEAVIRCAGAYPGGQGVSWDVRSLARFKDGRMVERWDRADLPVLAAQLKGAA
jgi:predicted ester cyclase